MAAFGAEHIHYSLWKIYNFRAFPTLKHPHKIETKPESKSQLPSPSQKSNRKGKKEFGLWAVSKILWATTATPGAPHPKL